MIQMASHVRTRQHIGFCISLTVILTAIVMHLVPFQSVLSSVALHVHCSQQRRSACVFIRISIVQVILTNSLQSHSPIQVKYQSINQQLFIC